LPPFTLSFTVVTSTDINTLSLHDALPIWRAPGNSAADEARRHPCARPAGWRADRGSAGNPRADRRHARRARQQDPADLEDQFLRSEEHTSELQSREKLVCRLLLAII